MKTAQKKKCEIIDIERKPGEDTLTFLKRTKDTSVLSEIIQTIDTFKEADSVSEYIPVLLKNRSWVLRADVLELIARSRYTHYAKTILKTIKKDPNVHVKSYALMAYYDLFGKRACSVLKQSAKDKKTVLKKTALCLLYIATRNTGYLKDLKRIVLRKNCWVPIRFAVYNLFDHYLELKNQPELIELFEIILGTCNPKWDVAKEIRVTVKQMKAERHKKAKKPLFYGQIKRNAP